MNNDIYEVTRDDYVGFVSQIKPEARFVETVSKDDYNYIKIFSLKTGTPFCSRMIPVLEGLPEKYYIYNMPLKEERQSPRQVRKITLQSKEEVQAFIDILSKAQENNK